MLEWMKRHPDATCILISAVAAFAVQVAFDAGSAIGAAKTADRIASEALGG